MSVSKFTGLLAGVSAVAVIGVAIAQGVEPDPSIANHPIAAGQQSSHMTPMGETGVLAWEEQLPRTAVVAPEPARAPVAAAPEPVAPVAQAQPAPEPTAAPATTMGAAPAPEPVIERQPEVVAEAPAPRADRN
jgi:hypothetical protein